MFERSYFLISNIDSFILMQCSAAGFADCDADGRMTGTQSYSGLSSTGNGTGGVGRVPAYALSTAVPHQRHQIQQQPPVADSARPTLIRASSDGGARAHAGAATSNSASDTDDLRAAGDGDAVELDDFDVELDEELRLHGAGGHSALFDASALRHPAGVGGGAGGGLSSSALRA